MPRTILLVQNHLEGPGSSVIASLCSIADRLLFICIQRYIKLHSASTENRIDVLPQAVGFIGTLGK